MKEVLYIAIAGALGAVGRYGVGVWAVRQWGRDFPYGTLIVNLAGCLALGFVAQLIISGDVFPRALRTPVTVGFLGAFTTFSTFGHETIRLMESGATWPAAGNIAANLLVGLLAAWGGVSAARMLVGA